MRVACRLEVSYADPKTFAEHNRQYWNSSERKAMALAPEDYLVSTEVREINRIY
ncbi:hypothetical protein [Nocardiopsis tropica]|uniref:Uncharacterized protein n=1 Tax=Nocardiopsis tropica TaxID=109330 RepID=A0ABV2A024_9ACTN